MAENISVAENNARFREYPYDLRRDWWNDLQHRKLEAMAARVHPGETVLDVGCNSGYFADFLPHAAEVHGVDLSPELVEKARLKLASAQIAPAEQLPFPDGSVDVVTMAGVIEYVHDPVAVLRELLRVARRVVVLEVNHEDGIWGRERVAGHAYMVRCMDWPAILALVESSEAVVSYSSTVHDGAGKPQHYIVEVSRRG